jgi:hypothetical protein
MTIYARVFESTVEALVDLTAEQYDALQANGKSAYLRLWLVDPKPTPTALQTVVTGPVVVGQTDARQTWLIMDKNQAELDAEQNAADHPTLLAMIAALTTDIDTYNANPDVSGTSVERLTKLETRVKDLERQQRRDNRILRYYLRTIR